VASLLFGPRSNPQLVHFGRAQTYYSQWHSRCPSDAGGFPWCSAAWATPSLILGCRSSRTYAALAYSLPEDLCSASAISYRSRLPRPSLFTEVSSRISRCCCRALFARASSRILSFPRCRCRALFARASSRIRSFPRCRCRALVGLVSALQSLAGSRGVACRCSLRVILITPRRVVTLVGRSAGLRMCER
jgi:hypothetical protein